MTSAFSVIGEFFECRLVNESDPRLLLMGFASFSHFFSMPGLQEIRAIGYQLASDFLPTATLLYIVHVLGACTCAAGPDKLNETVDLLRGLSWRGSPRA
jgi:hypothetical protein